MLDSILFGDNYSVIDYKNDDNDINIFLKSKQCEGICPNCKRKSDNLHSTYIRRIQDTPLHNKTTWLNITAYEFKCENVLCEVKTFTEELSLARKYKVMTDALVQFILSISIYLSSSASALILSFLGVKTTPDTINNIIKKIKVVDNPDVEEVGIDDVAIRKGQTYATAIYDMKDHHLIALLEGRDAENLKEWLKGHEKIKKVARDRASAYATAISEILPECIQVADRFHLFQNLISHLKDIFYAEIPDKIIIKNNKVVEGKIEKVPSELTSINEEKLNELNYDNLVPVDEFGNEIEFDSKKRDFDSTQYIEQKQRRLEKKNMVIELKSRLENNDFTDKHDLAKEYGICYSSLLKYEKMSDEEVDCLDKIRNYKKRKTLFDDYKNMIYKMLKDNVPQEYIVAYVMKKGYKGSIRGLIVYLNLIAKNNNMPYKNHNSFVKYEYPDDVIVIKRYDLLKFILTINPKKEKNEQITKYIDIISIKYPIVKDIQEIFMDFHDTIFSNDERKLDTFIEKHENKIKSFCSGLKKDIAAVKNAISYKINSGFVEGNNNKFKLIKRIVYGKQKISNLFKKNYLAFMSTLDNFCIGEIVENVLGNEKDRM